MMGLGTAIEVVFDPVKKRRRRRSAVCVLGRPGEKMLRGRGSVCDVVVRYELKVVRVFVFVKVSVLVFPFETERSGKG